MADITLGRVGLADRPGTVDRLLARLRLWRRRARERAQLSRLTGRELRDLGLTPSQAAYEAGKPFWRA